MNLVITYANIRTVRYCKNQIVAIEVKNINIPYMVDRTVE